MFVTAALLGANPGAFADTISDQTFAAADWSQLILYQTGPAASLVTGQAVSGGNPGSYRTVSHGYGGVGSIISGHIYTGDSYNPGVDGALASVSFSFDTSVFNAGDSNAVAFGALLYQSGSYYRAGFSVVFPGGWQTQSYATLTETDFSLILGSAGPFPDFSAMGAEIQFGFWASNGTGVARRTGTDSGIDNWQVTTVAASIPSTPNVPPVPDQGGLPLHAAGLLGVIFVARRLRR